MCRSGVDIINFFVLQYIITVIHEHLGIFSTQLMTYNMAISSSVQ